jgi:coenzyme F420 hydrogenase subunit beta
MKKNKIKNYSDLYQGIIDKGLCTRCGTCAGICPANAIETDEDAYPKLSGKCTSCGVCVKCCPGGDLDLDAISRQMFDRPYDYMDLSGTFENQYVGYPADNEIRYAGASGGVVTGLLIYLLEKGEIDGALVVGMDPEKPYKSKGILATTKEEIIKAAQSKYCITPSMEALRRIRKLEGRFAVVALPCQVHALRKLEALDRSLSKKIACILGLYCHCNLNQNGHMEAISASKIDFDDIEEFQFRGGGWPGGFHVIKKDGIGKQLFPGCMSTSMNIMFRLYGAQRCYLCVDALAEFADLSFGDFWARDYEGFFSTMERCTLISQRTTVGKILIENAVNDGALKLYDLPNERSSKRILRMAEGKKMRAAFRLRMRKLKGRPTPNYHVPLPSIKFKSAKSATVYKCWTLFNAAFLRKLVLQLFGSPLGGHLDRLNRLRKKHYFGLSGN